MIIIYRYLPWRVSEWVSIMPRRVLSKKGLHSEHAFPFWYIEWKPGRKFRSRIRMDGSAVCTRDTTPRTKMELNCGLVIFAVFDRFLFILFA